MYFLFYTKMAKKLLQTAAAKRRRARYRAKKKGGGFGSMLKAFKKLGPRDRFGQRMNRTQLYNLGRPKRQKVKTLGQAGLANLEGTPISRGRGKSYGRGRKWGLNKAEAHREWAAENKRRRSGQGKIAAYLARKAKGRAIGPPAKVTHAKKQLDTAVKALSAVKTGSGFSKAALKSIGAMIRRVKRTGKLR